MVGKKVLATVEKIQQGDAVRLELEPALGRGWATVKIALLHGLQLRIGGLKNPKNLARLVQRFAVTNKVEYPHLQHLETEELGKDTLVIYYTRW